MPNNPPLINSDLSIIIPSNDSYIDILREFIRYFFIFWADCPYEIIVVTNTIKINDNRVKSITTSINAKWGQRVIQAFKSTKTNYGLIMLEDAFLTSPVNTNYVQNIISFLKSNKAKYYLNPKSTNPHLNFKNNLVFHYPKKIRKDIPYSVTNLTAIWEKSELINLISSNDVTAWDIENLFLKISSTAGKKTHYEGYFQDENNFLNVIETINRGYWTRESKLFQKIGIPINYGNRKIAPFHFVIKKKVHLFFNFITPRFLRKYVKKFISFFGYKFVTKY
jgi:hypothetical protein